MKIGKLFPTESSTLTPILSSNYFFKDFLNPRLNGFFVVIGDIFGCAKIRTCSSLCMVVNI